MNRSNTSANKDIGHIVKDMLRLLVAYGVAVLFMGRAWSLRTLGGMTGLAAIFVLLYVLGKEEQYLYNVTLFGYPDRIQRRRTGSFLVATAATVVQFLMLPVNIYYCLRKLHIKPVIEKLPIALIKEMLGFSVFVFIGSIVDMLFWATDKVILGMLSGSVAVAIYNVGGTFNNMVMNLSTSISGVLTPRVTGMVVKDASKDELTNLFIRVGRLQFIVIALIVSGFTAFGQAFITLWAGKDYHDAYWVAILTMFPLCVPLIQNIGLTIVTAQNKHQFRSIIYMIIAILNVVTTYIAVPYCGILGAATCSCFAYILGQGIVMNIYYYKVTGLDIPLFWKNILKMAIVPGIMMFSGLLINRIYEIDNWIIFLIGIIVFTGIYIVLMYEVSFNEYERSIFREPLKRIIKRIKG